MCFRNALFILVFSLYCAFAAGMDKSQMAHQIFLKESESFIHRSSEQLKNQLQTEEWPQIYQSLNEEAAHLRHELAKSSTSAYRDFFGQKRFRHVPRLLTPLGTETYDSWRKIINERYFKTFFEQMAITGNNQHQISMGQWTLSFKLLEPTADSFDSEMTTDLSRFEGDLPKIDALEAINAVFMRFPHMDVFPSPQNTNLAVMKVSMDELHLGTYIIAIEGGDSASFKERAKIALKNFTEEHGGPFTGTLFLHSSNHVSLVLAERAQKAFFDCLTNLKSKASSEELKRSLARFRYYRSHAMEYIRGSAALAEWLEKILAESAGFSLVRDRAWIDEKNLDLCDNMALSLPPDEFVALYSKRTKLVPIKSLKCPLCGY